jgi:hypothetical protein
VNCIYCTRATTGSEGRAHAIPEALIQNDCVLPLGAVCGPCNNYLSELDSALIRHPLIGLAIQVIGTPGKTGRPRKKLSEIEREPADDPEALVRGGAIVYTNEVDAAGKGRVVASFRPDPSFDMLKFRRGLHYLAFNALAMIDGVEVALDRRWDRLRNYIRRPTPKQSRPFVQFIPDPGDMPPHVTVTPGERGAAEIFLIHIFGSVFAVELTESGRFEELAKGRNELGWVYVGPTERDPIGLRIEAGDP